MGFNIIGALEGAATGFLTAGPTGAAVDGALGGFSGSPNAPTALGTAGNYGLNAGMAGIQAGQTAQDLQMMAFQQQLDGQSSMFDEMMAQKAESMRESNVLRDAGMQQRKADDQIVKEFLQTIGG